MTTATANRKTWRTATGAFAATAIAAVALLLGPSAVLANEYVDHALTFVNWGVDTVNVQYERTRRYYVDVATSGDAGHGPGTSPYIGVSPGGCSNAGFLSVSAAGETGRGCETGWGDEASSWTGPSVGLLGADAMAWQGAAVSDSGSAGGIIAVSGTGNADGSLAVSGTGSSSNNKRGPATLSIAGYHMAIAGGDANGTTAAVGGRNAYAPSGAAAIAGTGTATSGGGLGALSVGGNSNANGGLVSIAVIGHARGGTVNYGGRGAG